MTRLKQFGWGAARDDRHRGGCCAAATTSTRASGQFLGNVVMGVVFGYWFHRTGRVMPLVIAHTILDVVAFVGYAPLRRRARAAVRMER